jgi:hypothetical protein
MNLEIITDQTSESFIFAFTTANIFNLSIISIGVLENVSPMQGYRKEPHFPH